MDATGVTPLGDRRQLKDAASRAFFDGFAIGCLVAAGVALRSNRTTTPESRGPVSWPD
jgi:hypothetical protein